MELENHSSVSVEPQVVAALRWIAVVAGDSYSVHVGWRIDCFADVDAVRCSACDCDWGWLVAVAVVEVEVVVRFGHADEDEDLAVDSCFCFLRERLRAAVDSCCSGSDSFGCVEDAHVVDSGLDAADCVAAVHVACGREAGSPAVRHSASCHHLDCIARDSGGFDRCAVESAGFVGYSYWADHDDSYYFELEAARHVHVLVDAAVDSVEPVGMDRGLVSGDDSYYLAVSDLVHIHGRHADSHWVPHWD
mmetsp:Transcript_29035/g.46026  ORF Transcript_29035/g.46026 Transcript_29035/m.46026 type:complete len:248 (+) Transcript_29035:922-1665(+)